MSKKDDKDKERESHGGSTGAEDLELSLWLSKQWQNGESPEKIELWQVFGRNKLDRGEMIHNEPFKAGEKLNVEQANKLANELLAVAQNDCDSARREAWYQLAIIDRNRKAVPLTRRIGPLQPKRSYAIKKVTDHDESADDEEGLTIGMLDIRRIKEANEQVRWDKSRNDRVVEGMLLLQDNIIKNQQQAIDRFFDKVMSSFEKMQEAEDRRVQRDILLEKEKFKIGLMKDGVRTVRNLLPQIFNGAENNGNGTTQESGNGSASNGALARVFGSSPERTLVDNFLNDIEEAKIEIALFGEHDLKDGKRVELVPGIFTFDQFYILASVRAGRMPVTALDNLMPGSGHENAITPEQIQKAGDAGVTEGMGMALLEIIGLRSRAKEAREAAARQNGTSKTDPVTHEESP